MTKHRSLAPLLGAAAALAGACSAPTHYHLISSTDAVRYLISPAEPPVGWAKPAFNDGAWAIVGGTVGPLSPDAQGAMPVVCARRKFDLGAQADAYHTLTLQVTTEGAWTAFLNGTQVAAADGHAAVASSISVPQGVLTASGNVLAIEVHPPAGTAQIHLTPVLDGQPDMSTGGAAHVVRGPWVVNPTATGTKIVWETDQVTPSVAVVDGKSFDGGAGTHHLALITGLETSKAYPYHVEVNGLASEEATLTTTAKPGERIRFVVYGDNRTNGDDHRRVVEAIESEGPDFLLNTGDLVDSSSDGEWNDFFNIEYSLIRKTPLYPTIGNHEASAGGEDRFAELFPVDGRATVGGGRVYGADFGDVHFAAIDSNADLDAQGRWLDQDLTDAEARGAKHLFVMMHWGPYSSGTALQHGSNSDARGNIAAVAKAHRVDALFEGHDHFYEHGLSDNLHYFVTGGGGAPLASSGQIAETVMSKTLHHYLVVDVSGPSVQVTAKDTSGTPFDQITLAR